MVKVLVILIVVAALASIAIFTPVIPWVSGKLLSQGETPQPPATATQPPTVAAPPTTVEVPPSENTTISGNALIFSEEELQGKMEALVVKLNQSGKASMEYIRVKLEQDRMLVSARGTVLGFQAETEGLAVRFEGRTMYASGKVNALGASLDLTTEVEIHTEAGRPSVEVKVFKMPFIAVLGLSTGKISELINGAVGGLQLPFDLDSIRIEGGKLIVVFK